MTDPVSLYRFRERLTLFECAALAHGYNPRDLSDQAVQLLPETIRAKADPRQFAQAIDALPDLVFPPEVSETIAALKIMASARAITADRPVADCRQWLAALGLSLPWSRPPQAEPAPPDDWRNNPAPMKSDKQAPARQICPRKPIKRVRDAWTEVIGATIDAFEAEHGFSPTAREAWNRLVNNCPDDWKYDYRQDRNDCFMAGEKEPLDQATFEQRFRRLFKQ